MSRDILIRSALDLLINALFCYIFVSAFGYVGAALGLAATLYFWTVPFNLHKIAKGFGVSWTELLPWRRLMGITTISALALPTAAAWHAFSSDWAPYLRLLFSATSYSMACALLLYYARFVDLPQRMITWLPVSLRRRPTP